MSESKLECFYVFYDIHDMVTCFGTARQLVDDGLFKDRLAVRQKANKISKGIVRGRVVVLK